MPQLQSRSSRHYPTAQSPADAANLSTVIYRSRAVKRMVSADLHRLTRAAEARNRAESITGLMLFDNDNFFQWLEGPADGVNRIMRSIRNDPRHTDIDVLRQAPTGVRRFRNWNMKLATSPHCAAWHEEAIEAPPEIVGSLRQDPGNAPELLARLAAASVHDVGDQDTGHSVATLEGRTASVLKTVLLRTVVPLLAQRYGLWQEEGLLRSSPRVAELADLLIAPDQSAALELIEELHAASADLIPLSGTLFEPAARALGDLWNEDGCSEFDVTLGLCRIQTAARLLGASWLRRDAGPSAPPAVLIAPEPGEIHHLGAALDSEALWHAGWAPRCEYPSDDHALEDILAGTWFDVLDLSLSAAFRREHRLPRLTATIAAARRASQNEALLVIVGGRMFTESGTAGAQVGADSSSMTAQSVERSILRGLDSQTGSKP